MISYFTYELDLNVNPETGRAEGTHPGVLAASQSPRIEVDMGHRCGDPEGEVLLGYIDAPGGSASAFVTAASAQFGAASCDGPTALALVKQYWAAKPWVDNLYLDGTTGRVLGWPGVDGW